MTEATPLACQAAIHSICTELDTVQSEGYHRTTMDPRAPKLAILIKSNHPTFLLSTQIETILDEQNQSPPPAVETILRAIDRFPNRPVPAQAAQV